MGSDQFTFQANVLPVVKSWASRAFMGDNDRETKLNDAASIAWEIFLTAPNDAPPQAIATFAIRRIRANRVFCESVRSLSSPTRRPTKAVAETFDVADVWRVGSDPARIAGFRIDFRQWFQRLKPRSQQIVELMVTGHTTEEIAETLGCTPGNVSQYRRRLATSWYTR